MSLLIDELKKDHAVLLDTLNKIKSLGISSADGQAALVSVKTTLLSHLKKEDLQLYPVLKKAANSDKKLTQILEIYANDMENISKFIFEFFDKYSKGGSGLSFAADFGKLFATLSNRIRREEEILYSEYEKLR